MNKITIIDQMEKILDKKGKMAFESMWKLLDEDKVAEPLNNKTKAEVFTDLNLDKRFVNLGENIWDLRVKHSYSKVHLPINQLYESDDEKAATKDTVDFESDIDTYATKNLSNAEEEDEK